MQKTSAELSEVKHKIWINKWLNLEFPYFFNTFVDFGQIQYYFKVLKTGFTIQYFFNSFSTVWEPCRLKKVTQG